MEIETLKKILTKNLKGFGKLFFEYNKDLDKDELRKNSFIKADLQEFYIIKYLNTNLNEDLKNYTFYSHKALIPLDKLHYYNHVHDRYDGDFGLYVQVNHNDQADFKEEVRFDLKVSTAKNKSYIGAFDYDSWIDFKKYNHFYLCISYDGTSCYLIDTTKITIEDFKIKKEDKNKKDQKDQKDHVLLGKDIEDLYKKKRPGIVKIKI